MQKNFPNEYVQLVNGLSSEEQAKLKANFDLAEQQKIDCKFHCYLHLKLLTISLRSSFETTTRAARETAAATE